MSRGRLEFSEAALSTVGGVLFFLTAFKNVFHTLPLLQYCALQRSLLCVFSLAG